MKTRAGGECVVCVVTIVCASWTLPAARAGNSCADNNDCSFLNTLCAVGFCDTTTFECGTLPINSGQACDDQDNCTTGDVCANALCSGTAVDCSGLNTACAVVTCDPGGAEGNCAAVASVNEGGACPGEACIEGQVCSGGVCSGGSATDCSGVGGSCATAECDPAGGEGNCDTVTPVSDDTPCQDGNACTLGDSCQGGTCTPSAIVDCSVNNTACQLFDCAPGGDEGNCSIIDTTTNQGMPCDEGGPCTMNEACDNGACVGTPVDCSTAVGECMTAECDPAGAEGNCSDVMDVANGTPCGVDDPCLEDSGECLGGMCDAEPKDSDGDGTPDCVDNCPHDPNKTEPGKCGCGKPDEDTDGDGIADCVCAFQPTCLNDDDCAAGRTCVLSLQPVGVCSCLDADDCATGDCLPSATGSGSSVCVTEFCGDLCPTDGDKAAPGECGCSVPDVDDDEDGVFDCGCLHTPVPCVDDQDCGPNGMCAACGIGGDCGGHEHVCVIGDGCGDWCPADPDKVVPGLCGCGFTDDADNDNDGDGVIDCVDACPDDPEKSASAGMCGCGEPDRSYTVGGIVHIPGNLLAGVPGVTVQLFCDDFPYNQTVTTCDAAHVGTFSFDNVPCGLCHLKFAYVDACDDHFDVMACGQAAGVGAGENVDIVVNAAHGAGHSPCLQTVAATAYTGTFDIIGFNEACREFSVGDPSRPDCMAERNGLPLTQTLPALAECFFAGGPVATCCPAHADFGDAYDVDCFCRLDCNSDGFFSIVSDLWCWSHCLVTGACQPGVCAAPAPARVNQGLTGHTIGGLIYSDEVHPLTSGVADQRVVVVDQDAYRYVVHTDELGVWAVDGLADGPVWVYYASSRSGVALDVNAVNQAENQSLFHVVNSRRGRERGPAVGVDSPSRAC